jgi:predicted nucleic acid-binding Zn ribbon protein
MTEYQQGLMPLYQGNCPKCGALSPWQTRFHDHIELTCPKCEHKWTIVKEPEADAVSAQVEGTPAPTQDAQAEGSSVSLAQSVEAVTFQQFVDHGRASGATLHHGMPWSFEYKGQTVTHENDECYLVLTRGGSSKFTPDDLLIEVNGELYVCRTPEPIVALEAERDALRNALEAIRDGVTLQWLRDRGKSAYDYCTEDLHELCRRRWDYCRGVSRHALVSRLHSAADKPATTSPTAEPGASQKDSHDS